LKSQKLKEESKKHGELYGVFINKISMITGKVENKKVNFSSKDQLKATEFQKNGGCYDSVLRKGK